MLIIKDKKNFFSKSFLFLILIHADISLSSTLNNQALQVVSNIFGISSPTPASTAKPSISADSKNSSNSSNTPPTTDNLNNTAPKTENSDLGVKKDILSQQPIALPTAPLSSIGNAVSNVFNIASEKVNNPQSPSTQQNNIVNNSEKKDILSQTIQTSTNTPVAIIGNSPTIIQNTPASNITSPQNAIITKVEENAEPTKEISNPPLLSSSSPAPNIFPTAPSQGNVQQLTLSGTSSDRTSIRRKRKNTQSLIVIDNNRKNSPHLKVLDEPNVVQKDPKSEFRSKPKNRIKSSALRSRQNDPIVLPSNAVSTSQTIQTGPESIQFYANHVTNQITEYRDDLIRIKNKIKKVKNLLNRATIEGINKSIKIQAELQNELATNEMNIDNTLKEITLALNESNQLISNNSQTNGQNISSISKISSELTIQQQLLAQCKKENTELLKTLNESIVLTKKAQVSLKPQIEAFDKISELNEHIYKNLKQANTAVSKSIKPVYSMTSLFGTQNAMISCHKKNRSDCLIRDQHCIWLKTEQECSLKCNAISSEEACNKVGDGLLCAWNIRGDKGYCYHKY
ncbi:MAG: hypothetical protein C0432_02275 [Candidatus Puniceispirillum sp.]|nr:hypothetical protein [Candidatus Pelagibacter sp.]MBA4283102.1 hypothetical protein [Candidatus Puniceispirillum sp.]